ncbi:MAG: hypothetical protein L0Y72_25435 [Gemmataceae bacterium]|nr:hypothetical protein [Gemmataceae bacterium]MCI0742389.1 hypothetical protein [Gemmataceae bacterium]
MCSYRLIAVGLTATALFWSALLGAQSKSKAKAEKILPIGYGGGKIIGVDEEEKTFTLRIFGASPVITFKPGNPASC